MANPIFTQSSAIVRGNLTKSFTFSVYKANAPVNTRELWVMPTVHVSTYSIEVEECWYREDTLIFNGTHDFRYVTSRSSEAAYAVSALRRCESIDEMTKVLEPLRVEFRASIYKDAIRKLRTMLDGKKKPYKPKVKKPQKPIPQIVLPWENRDK
jgi:hypothetical protein